LGQVTSPLVDNTVSQFNWNKKQYALPVGAALALLGYNKDLFQAAGVTPPDPIKPMSFDDFKAMAKKLTKTVNGKVVQYGFHPQLDRLDWNSWVSMAGGSAYDNYVNPTRVTINTPEGIAGLTAWNSLFKENIVPSLDTWYNGDWGDAAGINVLKTGKVAMGELGPWDFVEINSKKLNYGIAPYPVIKQQAEHATTNGFGIFKGSAHPKEAWEFIKWALQPPNQLNFAKFSDLPVDKQAFNSLATVINPKEFAGTLLAQLPALKPALISNKKDLRPALDAIVADMSRGRYTPEQAAAEMEKQGNAILGVNSK
jgi:multiple sugar transport system substrate-binding protein